MTSFRMPDSYYDPPTYYFYMCTECEWTSDDCSTIKNLLDKVDQCPLCESAVEIECN